MVGLIAMMSDYYSNKVSLDLISCMLEHLMSLFCRLCYKYQKIICSIFCIVSHGFHGNPQFMVVVPISHSRLNHGNNLLALNLEEKKAASWPDRVVVLYFFYMIHMLLMICIYSCAFIFFFSFSCAFILNFYFFYFSRAFILLL